MGIYDREYVRVGPRSHSGVGALRFVSFNTWLIVINVAVFALDLALASMGNLLPVDMGRVYSPAATPEQIARAFVVPIDHEAETMPGVRGRYIVDSRGASLDGVPLTSSRMALADEKRLLEIGGQPFEIIGEHRYSVMPPLQKYFHFSSARLFFHLEFWRLLGFQFLHANITHLFLNMLGLFFFGGLVEGYLGFKRYAAFYLTCGIFGGVSYLLLNLLGQLPVRLPGVLINDIYTPLIGASAGVFGVIVASAFIMPNAQVLLFFILPMRLATAAYGFVALAAVNLLFGGANAGGDAAHLGGAAAGYYFIRHTHLLRDFFEILGPSKRREAASKGRERERRTPDDAALDAVLTKVHSSGLYSLSEEERRILRRATESRQRPRQG